MEIPKDKIIEFIREKMGDDKAQQAQQELPDQVDTDRDRGLLPKYGIDPQELMGKFGGSIPGLSARVSAINVLQPPEDRRPP